MKLDTRDVGHQKLMWDGLGLTERPSVGPMRDFRGRGYPTAGPKQKPAHRPILPSRGPDRRPIKPYRPVRQPAVPRRPNFPNPGPAYKPTMPVVPGLPPAKPTFTSRGLKLARKLPYGWVLAMASLGYLWYYREEGAPGYDMSGWTQFCKQDWSPNPYCDGTPSAYIRWASTATYTCGTNFQVGNGAFAGPYGTTIPAGSRSVVFGPTSGYETGNCSTLDRFDFREVWRRPSPAPSPAVPLQPGSPPVILPEIPPVPGYRPVPHVPYALIPYQPNNPYRDASNGPKNDPAPAARSNPRRFRGGKETKIISAWKKALLAVWGAATEVPDWVNGMWDAMPRAWQKHQQLQAQYFLHRPLRLGEKAGLILRDFELIDGQKALYNILYNIVEDAVAGRIIRQLDRAGIGTTFGGGLYVKKGHRG